MNKYGYAVDLIKEYATESMKAINNTDKHVEKTYIMRRKNNDMEGNSVIKNGQAYDVLKRRDQLCSGETNAGGMDDYIIIWAAIIPNVAGLPAFRDTDIHAIMRMNGINTIKYIDYHTGKEKDSEMFIDSSDNIDAIIKSYSHACELVNNNLPFYGSNLKINNIKSPYYKRNLILYAEQQKAVDATKKYIENNSSNKNEMLLACKCRFGKTVTALAVAKSLKYKKILILTYKPVAQSAWSDDAHAFYQFSNYTWIDNKNINELKSHDEFICFSSLQRIITKDKQGNIKTISKDISNIDFDCIIIDEYHFGAYKGATDKAICNDEDDNTKEIDFAELKLSAKLYLYVSATPYNALRTGKFNKEQIYKYDYIDEQRDKENHKNDIIYDRPKLNIFSIMPSEKNKYYIDREDTTEFGLNEFFSVNKSTLEFKHKAAVAEFVSKLGMDNTNDIIAIHGEYSNINCNPLSRQFMLQQNDCHIGDNVIFYLHDTYSCNAMANMLENTSWVKNNGYRIIRVYGGSANGNVLSCCNGGIDAIKKIKNEIKQAKKNFEKTITITCGMAMTSVTVPEWTSIFMLSDISALESYIQSIYRVQSPYKLNGKQIKQNCYVFDFSPNRLLNTLSNYTFFTKNYNRHVGINDIIYDMNKFINIVIIDGKQVKEISINELTNEINDRYTSFADYDNFIDRRFITNNNFDGLEDSLQNVEEFSDLTDFTKIAVTTNVDKAKKKQRRYSHNKSSNDVISMENKIRMILINLQKYLYIRRDICKDINSNAEPMDYILNNDCDMLRKVVGVRSDVIRRIYDKNLDKYKINDQIIVYTSNIGK